MDEIANAPTTLREALEENFDKAEEGTLVEPSEGRDELGRFATKEPDPEVKTETPQEPLEAAPVRPTTWKKEYLPLWEKLHQGLPLTPDESKKVAEYSGIQREKEFANGVSTYKAEATNAKQLQEAIAPFMADLQASNVAPAVFIKNLGTAHTVLSKGSPEQKLQMFQQLAREYNIPLAAVGQAGQGQLDPIVPQLMQQIQQLSGQVNTVTNWRQQQEAQSIQQQLAPFQDQAKYPHYEAVRNDMALLLESGKAPNLEDAYKLAVRLNDDVWTAEQTRLSQVASQSQAAAKAKSRAVSVKSVTPTGQATPDAKDRRSILSAQIDAAMNGRV